ncbi:hypothetical protein HPB50_023911 [Hyalomma asiaticum]|uniref:Uncharacterized protein n=1 Tax=Hyalomma asiaticum TaxID=266040 RepID=A0ACB7SB97_HYAAI|nr:hypothetical protein HPB50_023911 [Hyalomma asiaticum]
MVVPGTSSSSVASAGFPGSSGSRPRSLWTEAETWVLLRLWEDHLPQLRGEKHNARVYDAIVATLAESGILRARRQEGVTLRNHRVSTISLAILHRNQISLGRLPVNDPSLIQESASSPNPNETVEQVISSMESNTSASAEDITEEAPSDSQEPTPSKPQQQRHPQKRKRTTAAETFRSTLLEQQGRLLSALEQAAKDHQALRERQVHAQEKLVDLSQYFSK